MIDAIMAVCVRFKIHPAEVYRDAYHYYEYRVHPKTMYNQFIDLMEHIPKTDDAILRDVPDWVTDYCLDVLTGRAIRLSKYYKLALPETTERRKREQKKPPRHKP